MFKHNQVFELSGILVNIFLTMFKHNQVFELSGIPVNIFLTMFTQLCVRVCNLLVCENICNSLRGEVWANKTSFTLPLFIEVPVQKFTLLKHNQVFEQSEIPVN